MAARVGSSARWCDSFGGQWRRLGPRALLLDSEIASHVQDLYLRLVPSAYVTQVDLALTHAQSRHVNELKPRWQARSHDEQALAGGVGAKSKDRLGDQRYRSCRPRLRPAGHRVGHRLLVHGPLFASKQLGKPVIREGSRRVEQGARELVQLVFVSVALESHGDDRVVVRPDRSHVISEGIMP